MHDDSGFNRSEYDGDLAFRLLSIFASPRHLFAAGAVTGCIVLAVASYGYWLAHSLHTSRAEAANLSAEVGRLTREAQQAQDAVRSERTAAAARIDELSTAVERLEAALADTRRERDGHLAAATRHRQGEQEQRQKADESARVNHTLRLRLTDATGMVAMVRGHILELNRGRRDNMVAGRTVFVWKEQPWADGNGTVFTAHVFDVSEFRSFARLHDVRRSDHTVKKGDRFWMPGIEPMPNAKIGFD